MPTVPCARASEGACARHPGRRRSSSVRSDRRRLGACPARGRRGAAPRSTDRSAGSRLNARSSRSVGTASSNGYYLFAEDGGVFAFGDAPFRGSLGGLFASTAASSTARARATGNGYYMVGSDGGVFSFGDAPFHGSLGAAAAGRADRRGAMSPPTAAATSWSVPTAACSRSVASHSAARSRVAPAVSPRRRHRSCGRSGDGYWVLLADGRVLRVRRRGDVREHAALIAAADRRDRSRARRRRLSARHVVRRRRVRLRQHAVPRLRRGCAAQRSDRRRRADRRRRRLLDARADGGVFTFPGRGVPARPGRRTWPSSRSPPASAIPWDLGFLPDGALLFTERPGRIARARRRPAAAACRCRVRRARRAKAGCTDSRSIPTFASNGRIYTCLQHDRRARCRSSCGRSTRPSRPRRPSARSSAGSRQISQRAALGLPAARRARRVPVDRYRRRGDGHQPAGRQQPRRQGAARRPLQRRGRARQPRRAAVVHARAPQRARARVPARRAARPTRSSTAPTATTNSTSSPRARTTAGIRCPATTRAVPMTFAGGVPRCGAAAPRRSRRRARRSSTARSGATGTAGSAMRAPRRRNTCASWSSTAPGTAVVSQAAVLTTASAGCARRCRAPTAACTSRRRTAAARSDPARHAELIHATSYIARDVRPRASLERRISAPTRRHRWCRGGAAAARPRRRTPRLGSACRRRHFLHTLCGAATMLVGARRVRQGVEAGDAVRARRSRAARSTVSTTATTDPDAAADELTGDEFIFDVQTHLLDFDLPDTTGQEFGQRVPVCRMRRRRLARLLRCRPLARRAVRAFRHDDGRHLGGPDPRDAESACRSR